MTESSGDKLRVSDTERESAISALGDHMAAGRIDVEEYGQRSARVTTARTRGDVLREFADLPDPKPAFLTDPLGTGGFDAGRTGTPAPGQRPKSLARQGMGLPAILGVAAIAVIGLTVLSVVLHHAGFLFILIPVLVIVSRARQGSNRPDQHRRHNHPHGRHYDRNE
ncbi:DUF1707 SHOCT-like domain-containing protein [Sciscionella marina]|uniref:DUF1707 SHOCT-like domain-containing protein n=1 Tax=Sciscionella marina TaxID=508770 RepID=UPI000370476F|nr:DUF1707 domain-containing protein [Sciscionella marina]